MTGLLDDWIIGLMVDHLDPETIRRYPAKAETWFVAPHRTALHLQELGVPTNRVVRLDVGQTRTLGGVEVRGVFALPTGADVLDTTGYFAAVCQWTQRVSHERHGPSFPRARRRPARTGRDARASPLGKAGGFPK